MSPARSHADSLVPPEAVLQRLAAEEHTTSDALRELLLDGRATVLGSHARVGQIRACVVGAGLRTKVNANFGTSALSSDLVGELHKLDVAIEAGADAVMDLSTGGDIRAVRGAVLARASVPVGTVPVYEAAVQAAGRSGGPTAMTLDSLIAAVRNHAEQGVDFQTVHASITRSQLSSGAVERRRTGIVSRGGALLACWMRAHDAENPYYERFDEVLDICRGYGVTLSLGDSMRPGCLADAGDEAQMTEVAVLGGLVQRARDAGVRVIVEGPGHVPLHEVAAQVTAIKRACHGVPLYVLGPLVTDVAPGYDHITSAIGGTLAAMSGADFLCYVTRAEHVRLPNADDVREGVIACRIAAHAGDVAAGLPGAREWDEAMATARKALDWPGQFALAIDPTLPAEMRAHSDAGDAAECTMCGPLCSMRVTSSEVLA
ncbi:MAG: phosphomethylpyrimidine synthase ThiC [Actinobacteria bacterium]|nr:phosphomethylpyrimidine synthase ThiC [Actinomycetota bacterium]